MGIFVSGIGIARSPSAAIYILISALMVLWPGASAGLAQATVYDVVILHGRVMDPESGLDAIRNVGINNGRIQIITEQTIKGLSVIDASGSVVAPGFIDLHVHGMDEENHRYQAMDGVTTVLELEGGVADIDSWYDEREGKTLINFGASIGHAFVREAVLGDPDWVHRPATQNEIEAMKRLVRHGLERGAVAVGFGIQYSPGASRWEILEMFRIAAEFGASCHPHIRYAGLKEPGNSIAAVQEVIADAALTGAPLHIVHIQSSGMLATPQLLQMVREAQARGLDVTTECYPYTAAMTGISTPIFDEGWSEQYGITYKDLQWVATGERLTAESFARYRKAGGDVIAYLLPEEVVRNTVADPLTMIASDGRLDNGKGHPRSSGTFSRVLGHYVREDQALTLMDALRKMTLMPARRLERRVPAMKQKGRISVGADADITVFDPEHIIDRSTYEAPARFSDGIKHVLVNGVPVVKDGHLQEKMKPGRPVRAPVR